jgi:ribosomal 30S subunit maturation factor RimM
MLLTNVKPADLWGKKVYDVNGHFLGEVVAIGSRLGIVHKVVVRRGHDRPITLVPDAQAYVDPNIVVLPGATPAGRPRLWLVE